MNLVLLDGPNLWSGQEENDIFLLGFTLLVLLVLLPTFRNKWLYWEAFKSLLLGTEHLLAKEHNKRSGFALESLYSLFLTALLGGFATLFWEFKVGRFDLLLTWGTMLQRGAYISLLVVALLLLDWGIYSLIARFFLPKKSRLHWAAIYQVAALLLPFPILFFLLTHFISPLSSWHWAVYYLAFLVLFWRLYLLVRCYRLLRKPKH